MSNNLNLTQVAAAQNQKEVTINDQAGQIDAAITEVLALTVDNTNVLELTDIQFRGAFIFVLSNAGSPPTAQITLDTATDIKRGVFAIQNNTTQVVLARSATQSGGEVQIKVGETKLLYCDGSVFAEFSSSPLVEAVTEATTARNLILTDAGKDVYFTNSGATTATVDPDATTDFPIGTFMNVIRYGAGTLTIAAGAGVTINSANGVLTLANQYSAATLKKVAADEWLLVGDLA